MGEVAEKNHWDDNGDMVVVERTVFRRVGWMINGGALDHVLIGEQHVEKFKADLVPHGSLSPIYIEVGD